MKDQEFITIITIQAIFSADPDKPPLILEDTIDLIVGKAVAGIDFFKIQSGSLPDCRRQDTTCNDEGKPSSHRAIYFPTK